jgi:hypothetical protein
MIQSSTLVILISGFGLPLAGKYCKPTFFRGQDKFAQVRQNAL